MNKSVLTECRFGTSKIVPPEEANPDKSRRAFLKSSVAATAAISTLASPGYAYTAGDDKLRIGLVGCGGRGTGAAVDALHADPRTEITALGDTFADRIEGCLSSLKEDEEVSSRVSVDKDHQFVGFYAYKQVIDSGVDVVLLATSPHFRPQHLEYAIQQGKHCFVEKPVAVDVPGVLKVEQACKSAKEKGLSVVSGLCWRYDKGVQATMEKIANGAIGDIIAIESAYNGFLIAHRGNKPEWSQMEYQIRNWYYYTWLSGDHIVEQAVHSLDKSAWLLGDVHPLRAYGTGGRQQRVDEKYGNIFDHHTIFFEFPNDVKVFFTCRQQDNTSSRVEELVLGSDGQALVLANRIQGKENWKYRGPKPSMYRVEHEELFKSIRNSAPINDGHHMCNSTLMGIMGRDCTYTGQEITWDQFMQSTQRLGPDTYEWGDVSVLPVAVPGITKLI